MAILLSGDKEFLPALTRNRQKGKRVALVSFKSGCNRELFESPHAIDYDVVWLDECLDDFIVPMGEGVSGSGVGGGVGSKNNDDTAIPLSSVSMLKVIRDFVFVTSQGHHDQQTMMMPSSDGGGVSSRDIGRYLKKFKVGKHTRILEQLKDM